MNKGKKWGSVLLSAVLTLTSVTSLFTGAIYAAPDGYQMAELELIDGENVPLVSEAGTFGRLSGEEGSVVYHTDPEGDYIRLVHENGNADLTPSLGYVFPEGTAESKVTVEYDLRLDTALKVNDKYLTAGFDSAIKPFGFDGYAARTLLNRNGICVDEGGMWSFVPTDCEVDEDGDLLSGVWNSWKMVLDMTSGKYQTYVNGVLKGEAIADTSNVKKFMLGFGNWGGNPALTYSVKNFRVSFEDSTASGGDVEEWAPDPDPFTQGDAWTAPENAEETWVLNDQIANMSVGESLPAYSSGEVGFSVYAVSDSPENDTLQVKGEGDQKYVEISYSGTKDRNPQLVFNLPNTYKAGTVSVDFKLYMKPGSAMHWMEAVLGADAVGIDNGAAYAGRLILDGNGYAEASGGPWLSTKPFRAGGWYRYVVTIDVGLQTMNVKIWTPLDTEPSSFDYTLSQKRNVSQFVVKPYAPGSGVLCVKDVALSYVAPDRTPSLMAPKDDTYMADVNPIFTWSNTGADSYTLEISKTSDFSGDVIRITGLTDTTYTPETPLESFTEYYWRVTAVTGGEEPITSAETFMLTTESEDIEGNVYYAKNFGLVEGIFSEEIPEERAIAQHNAAIIQNLLDKAGKKGGGTVILPEGDFCLCGDYTTYDARILYIRYDNVTLTGQGRDENGVYKTRLHTNSRRSVDEKVYRNGGIVIVGTPFGSEKARENIEISHFEMDGGRGYTGRSDWGFDPNIDWGWDISHQGIVVSKDDLVTNVTLDDLYVHSYSGETLYVGGKSVGYLEVKNCTLADTNASCFNLNAKYLNVHDNQFGSPDGRCRFWIEYCPRKCLVEYSFDTSVIPEGIEPDTAYFRNNKFYNSVNAHGIAIAQGDCTEYAMYFENNEIDNSLDENNNGIFQLAGAVYGPIYIRNNTIQNTHGPILVFSYGGGTVDENGVPNVDWAKNKNIYLENNTCVNLGSPIIDLMGSWGVWDPTLNDGAGGVAPWTQPVENLYIRNNYFEGADPQNKSIAIGSFYDTIESAIELNNTEVSGNTFKNCLAPEEVRAFIGKVPLFKDNTYSNVTATSLGGIANLGGSSAELKPVYEYLTLTASEAVNPTFRVGKNENGQKVTITGGVKTNPVTFVRGAESYFVPEEYRLEEGDTIVFVYDAEKAIWNFVSFEKASEEEKPPAVDPGTMYEITATAGEGGTITPDGKITVPSGGEITYVISAEKGYRVDKVILDGEKEVELLDGTYTFYEVNQNHSIHVTFIRIHDISEEPTEGPTERPTKEPTEGPGDETTPPPATGDSNAGNIFAVLSALALVAILYLSRKKVSDFRG